MFEKSNLAEMIANRVKVLPDEEKRKFLAMFKEKNFGSKDYQKNMEELKMLIDYADDDF